MIVFDASAFVDFTTQAERVPELVVALENAAAICAPTLVDYEYYNVLRKHVLANRVTPRIAEQAVKLYNDISILRFDTELLVDRMWELKNNVTAYDASYIALAEILGAKLYTGDLKMAGAPGHAVQVVLCRPAP